LERRRGRREDQEVRTNEKKRNLDEGTTESTKTEKHYYRKKENITCRKRPQRSKEKLNWEKMTRPRTLRKHNAPRSGSLFLEAALREHSLAGTRGPEPEIELFFREEERH